MKVTRDVIVDLWPVYESGAASSDTQVLVDAFLRDDPDFARKLREGEETMNRVLAAAPVMPPPDAERTALARTQLLLRLRFHFLAGASAFALLAVMWRQYRALSAVAALLSAAAWLGLFDLTRARGFASDLVSGKSTRPFEGGRLACAALCVSSGLFALVVRTFREYSVPLAIVCGLAWLGLEIASRRRPSA